MEQKDYIKEVEKLAEEFEYIDEAYNKLNRGEHDWFRDFDDSELSMSDYADIIEFTSDVNVSMYHDLETALDSDSRQKILVKMALLSVHADVCERMES